ncbi:MAG TPA: glycosyltransferase [Candidatus Limnocylindrales bacterium]
MSDLTVIIATAGQRPAMLDEAVRSVPKGVPIVVVDDATLGVGYARARLIGLQDVTSEYIAFLDDDDVLGPDWLTKSLALAEDGCDVVAASYWETDASLQPIHSVALMPATLSRLLGGHCPVNDGALIRRSVLEGVTWHPERDTVMMFSLWLDLLARDARFGVVTEPVWYHRVHEGQMSRTIGEQDAAWRAQAIAEHRPVPA